MMEARYKRQTVSMVNIHPSALLLFGFLYYFSSTTLLLLSSKMHFTSFVVASLVAVAPYVSALPTEGEFLLPWTAGHLLRTPSYS